MPSTINASTSAGAVITPDTSGVLALQTAGTTAITVDASQNVSIPKGVGGTPAFSAYQSTQQTGISSATFTKVNFQTEEFDTNSNFASSTFTPTIAGYYQINSIIWASGTFIGSFISIYKNGVRYKDGTFIGSTATYAEFASSANTLVYCNGSTDYIEIYVWANSTGTYSLQSSSTNGQYRVWFSGGLVRGA